MQEKNKSGGSREVSPLNVVDGHRCGTKERCGAGRLREENGTNNDALPFLISTLVKGQAGLSREGKKHFLGKTLEKIWVGALFKKMGK